MARQRMVTRTIKGINVTALIVDVAAKTVPAEATYTVSGKFKNDSQILKAIAKIIPENIKVLAIIETSPVTTLYGMTELEFIQVAKPITNHNAKEN